MKVLSLITFVLATITTWVLMTPLAIALPDNVSNSKHNFSGNNYVGTADTSFQYVGEFNEVCKYCHTPHNAGTNKLLWNKANLTGGSAVAYNMYTSSKSLTRATVNASFAADSPSLLCLGCHDGKTAMNVMHSSSSGVDASGDGYPSGSKYIMNFGSYTPTPLDDNPGFAGSDPQNLNLGKASDGSDDRLGSNLADDHPLGFSYSSVLSEDSTGLFSVLDVGTKSSNRIKFFGTAKKVECSTCHNPHADADDTSVFPFLVMNNAGSALCLSCHNK
jgi:predicted CXXCH cytochrome family protein